MYDAQDQDLASLEALAHVLQDDRRRAEVALHRSGLAIQISDYPNPTPAAQASAQLAGAFQDVHGLVAGHFRWGAVPYNRGGFDTSWARFEQARALARAAGLRQEEADSVNGPAFVCLHRADFDGWRTHSEQALDVFPESGDRQGKSRALFRLGWASFAQGPGMRVGD